MFLPTMSGTTRSLGPAVRGGAGVVVVGRGAGAAAGGVVVDELGLGLTDGEGEGDGEADALIEAVPGAAARVAPEVVPAAAGRSGSPTPVRAAQLRTASSASTHTPAIMSTRRRRRSGPTGSVSTLDRFSRPEWGGAAAPTGRRGT